MFGGKVKQLIAAFIDQKEQVNEAIVALSKKIEKLGDQIINLHDVMAEKDEQIKELRQELKARTEFSEKLLLLMLHSQKEEAATKAAEPKLSPLAKAYLEKKENLNGAGPKGKLP